MNQFNENQAIKRAFDNHVEVYPELKDSLKYNEFVEDPDNKGISFLLNSRNDRTYMIDSGASFHLIGKSELSHSEKKTIRTLPEPIPLCTANKVIFVREHCKVFIVQLKRFV